MGSSYSAFSTEQTFPIFEIGQSGIETGFVRVQGNEGDFYDFKIGFRPHLILAENNRSRYTVTVAAYDISRAKVDPNSQVGMDSTAVICGYLTERSVIRPPKDVSMQLGKNPLNANYSTAFFDETPGSEIKEYDPDDRTAATEEYVGRAGLMFGQGGATLKGPGPDAMVLSPDGEMSMNVQKMTSATQEEDKGGGLFTTSTNFLHHFFIGIANTVSLPMPHMPGILKMASIGVFVNNIASAGRKAYNAFKEEI